MASASLQQDPSSTTTTSDSTSAWDSEATYTYSTVMVPPPGIDALAPNGFPVAPLSFPSKTKVPQAFIDAMIIRVRVFVDEQKCGADVEIDEDDPRSWHWVLYAEANAVHVNDNDGGRAGHAQDPSSQEEAAKKRTPVSVIRIVPPPHGPHPNETLEHGKEIRGAEGKEEKEEEEEPPYVKLGRVATLKEWRRKGLSRRLIEEAFAWLSEHGREEIGPEWKGDVLCHAQVEAEPMYARVGFRTDDRLGRWIEEGIEHLGMWRRIDLQRTEKKKYNSELNEN